MRHRLRRNSVRRSRANIRYHYDLGEDFYALFLDPSLTYSCAIFDPPGLTLADAQREKFERIARKLELSPGRPPPRDRHRLGRVRDPRGDAVRLPRDDDHHQPRPARFRSPGALEREGLSDRITLLFEDYRRLTGRFDKAVSIEMFEAVGLDYYDDYFGAVDRLLEPGGTMLLQTITINEARFERYRRQPDFIQRHIFPGSELASVAEIDEVARPRDAHVGRGGRGDRPSLRRARSRPGASAFSPTATACALSGSPRASSACGTTTSPTAWAGFAERYIGDAQILLDEGGRREGRGKGRAALHATRP